MLPSFRALASDEMPRPARTPATQTMPAPFFITGPTASGKSALAVALAERVGGEIVNADAFQLYEGMDLLTAKPSSAEMRRVPHHLYSVLPLTQSCDAQRYRRMALPVIEGISARGLTPIVVGGSGLYIKALSHGLAELPAADPALRARLAALSHEEKRAQLLRLDPDAGVNVPLANPRYVDRALEVCLLTGQPQSRLRRTFDAPPPAGAGVSLVWPRFVLHARIEQRARQMIEAGLLEEVRHLPPAGPTAEKAIGLREMRAHLAGEMPLDEAAALMTQATRQYAKRQLTWFRRESWLQSVCLPADAAAESALALILHHFPCPLPPQQPPSTSA